MSVMHMLLTIIQAPKTKKLHALGSRHWLGIKARINRGFIIAQKFLSTEMLFLTTPSFATNNHLNQVLNQ